MDGYAVVASDVPGVYKVVGNSCAGSGMPLRITSGQIMRVSTGAPVPDGSDAVVMVEDTNLVASENNEELKVEILATATPNQFIRGRGSDIKTGEMILRKGHMITGNGGEIGVLTTLGISHISVYRKPIVGVLSTGNELVPFNSELIEYGKIRDCNRPALIAAISSAGFQVIDLGICSDSEEALQELFLNALRKVDLIITTGGVSMGEHDYLKPVLERKLNATIHFGRIRMKPGYFKINSRKPTTFSTVPFENTAKPVFSLPGNPVSALVAFHLLTIPALKAMSGQDCTDPVFQIAVLDHDLRLDPRPEFHRAKLYFSKDEWHVETTGMQQSSRILSLVSANGMIVLPAATETQSIMAKGSRVKVYVF